MNIFLPEILIYLSILIISLVVTYLIGLLPYALLPEARTENNAISNIFNSLVMGFMVLVTIFALIWTCGNSIMWLSIIIFFLYFFLLQDKKKSPRKINLNRSEWYILISGIILCMGMFFLIYWLQFTRTDGTVFPDIPFYANLSNKLVRSHIENPDFLNETKAAGFYHWGEIWFNAFWCWCFGLNHYYGLLLVTYPYFAVLTILGAAAIVKEFLSFKPFFCIILGATFLVYLPILTLLIPFAHDPLIPKYFIIYVLLLWYCLNMIRGKIALSFLTLFCIVPFFSTMSPGCLCLMYFTSVWYIWKDTCKVSKAFFNKYFFFGVLIVVLFFLFYLLQPDHTSEIISNNTDFPIKKYLTYFKHALFLFGRFIPVIIFLLIFREKLRLQNVVRYETIVSLIIAALMSGFVAVVIANIVRPYLMDGVQINSVYVMIVTNVVLFTTLIYLCSFITKYKILLIILSLISVSIFVQYREIKKRHNNGVYLYGKKGFVDNNELAFYQTLKDDFGMNKQHIIQFAYYRTYQQTQKNSWLRRLNMIYPLSKMVHVVPNGFYAPYCLSAMNIPEDTNSSIYEKKKSQIWKFIEEQKQKGNFISIEKSMIDFIEIKEINYLIIESGAMLPSYLEEKVSLISTFENNQVYKIFSTN